MSFFFGVVFPFSHAYNVDGFLLVNHFFHGTLACSVSLLLLLFPFFSAIVFHPHSWLVLFSLCCRRCCYRFWYWWCWCRSAAATSILRIHNKIHMLQEFLPMLFVFVRSLFLSSFNRVLSLPRMYWHSQRFIYIIYMGGVNQIIP